MNVDLRILIVTLSALCACATPEREIASPPASQAVIPSASQGQTPTPLTLTSLPTWTPPSAAISLAPRPGWKWHGPSQPGYRYQIAYPQVWNVYPNKYKDGQTIFQSPETGTEVRVDIRLLPAGTDWLAWAREHSERVFRLDLDPASITPNSTFLGREAVFVFEPAHFGTGESATLLFADGDRLFTLYLYAGAEPPLAAEAAIYQYMLTTFALNHSGTLNDYSMPDGAWDQVYDMPTEITGTVLGTIADGRIILLSEPTQGFISVTLLPDGELVNNKGEVVEWDSLALGAVIRAQGAAGERGTYLADQVWIMGN